MAVQFNQRTISDFKSKLVGGGARPNLFEVQVAFPEEVLAKTDAEAEIPFMVKAAELPASNVGDIPVNFRGRILHVAGDRTFDPWTVTVINNTDWKIRKAFESWSDLMNDRTYDTASTSPLVYQMVIDKLKINKSNVCFVSANNWDVAGAKSFGFYSVWVNRNRLISEKLPYQPDLIINSLDDLT